MEVTRKLVDFSLKTTFSDLPKAVVKKTKEILLDSVGCALGSYVIDRPKIAIALAEDIGGHPQATIIGSRRTSGALAAFVNAELINALDYDAVGPAPHVAPYVIPPCLAIAERTRATGEDLITAIALAMEIGGRVALSMGRHRVPAKKPPYYKESPRFSYTSAIFGAVAGAGKLLHLDSKAMANAFGIAGASTPAPGMMKWEYSPPPGYMVKYNLWPGWVAQLATVSVLAAERGFTGDVTILDGERGHWQIIASPYMDLDTLMGDMGEKWLIMDVGYKWFPTCYINHTGIKAIKTIVHKNNIQPEDIEEIVVKGDPLLMMPIRDISKIRTFEDTQFCNKYIFALAAFKGNKQGPGWQMPSTFNDPAIQALMGNVKVAVHPRTDELIISALKKGNSSFCDVIVELTAKGKKFTAEVSEPKGSPCDPITEEELIDKFRNNAYYAPIKSDNIPKIIKTIFELEKIRDVAKFMELLMGY